MYLDGTMYNGHLAILHRPESYYEDSETASSTIGRLVIVFCILYPLVLACSLFLVLHSVNVHRYIHDI